MKTLRQMTWALCALFSLLLVGCNTLPRGPSAANPDAIYVWPKARCPSQEQNLGALGAAFINALGGDLISGSINAFASRLSAAAAADKTGYKVSNTHATYYSVASRSGDQYTVVSPGCYVVALTKPARNAAAWCDDPEFSKTTSCTVAHGTIEAISQPNGKPAPGKNIIALAPPKLYMEIQLVPDSAIKYVGTSADAGTVALPRIASLYYPKPLIGGTIEAGKPRHLTLNLTFAGAAPSQSDPFKAATIALDVFGIVPSPIDPKAVDDTLSFANNSLHTAWTLIPAGPKVTMAASAATPPALIPYQPVTVTGTLNEIGDENAFLQAISGALTSQSSTAALTTAIGNTFLPQGAVAQANSDASIKSAQGKYLSAAASYQQACAKLHEDKADAANPASSTHQKSSDAILPDTTTLQASEFNADSAWASLVSASLPNPPPITQLTLSCP